MWMRVPEFGPDAWILDLNGLNNQPACRKCGSQLFNVAVDTTRMHCQIFGITT